MLKASEISNLKLPRQRIVRALGRITTLGTRTWQLLRQISGDAAYENYLRSRRRREGFTDNTAGVGQPGRHGNALSREEFYLDSLRRRYSGVSRCC